MEIITLKPPFFPQKMDTSNYRGRPKIDLAESSKRTKRRRIALLEEYDESAASILRSSDFQPNLKSSEANIEKVV